MKVSLFPCSGAGAVSRSRAVICVYTPFMQIEPTLVCWAVLQPVKMRNSTAQKGHWHGADAPPALHHLITAAAGDDVCSPLASPRGFSE